MADKWKPFGDSGPYVPPPSFQVPPNPPPWEPFGDPIGPPPPIPLVPFGEKSPKPAVRNTWPAFGDSDAA